jgi:WD40 repeat protein
MSYNGLQGHLGIVISIAWSPNSIFLSSIGIDGAIYSWFMDGFHRYAERVTKGSMYSCLQYDQHRKVIYACGPNIPIRAIDTDKKIAIQQSFDHRVDGSLVERYYEGDKRSEACWEHHIFRCAHLLMILNLYFLLVFKSHVLCVFFNFVRCFQDFSNYFRNYILKTRSTFFLFFFHHDIEIRPQKHLCHTM